MICNGILPLLSIHVKYIYFGEVCECQGLVEIARVSYFCLPDLVWLFFFLPAFYFVYSSGGALTKYKPAAFLQPATGTAWYQNQNRF